MKRRPLTTIKVADWEEYMSLVNSPWKWIENIIIWVLIQFCGFLFNCLFPWNLLKILQEFDSTSHSFNINIDVLFHRLSIISFCIIRGWGCGEKIKFISRVNKRGEGYVLGTGESLYTKYAEYLLKRTEQWFAFPCSFVQFQWKITGVCIY